MDKPTVKIRICKLDVGGITLLINFGGFHFHIRASVLWEKPLLLFMVGVHILGPDMHYGM